ncbi:MAG: epoxyqueuosine reductase QueH [Bacteroidales bacterium]|nr:epoxyqueuosine reductase QueH [Bacteroidales bacterium]
MNKVLLHTCCAPCSSAILEWMLARDIRPVIFYSNPNIDPREEYERRRSECKRYAALCGVAMVEDAYDHAAWLREAAQGREDEPERGARCLACFRYRLLRAARYAAANGFDTLATTLASSRWKNLDQVNAAGAWACSQVEGVSWWDKNWRKDGLQERRNQLIKELNFYNQRYCGCEFSRKYLETKE